MLRFFDKNPYFIFVMHTLCRRVILGDLLFLSLDACFAADA